MITEELRRLLRARPVVLVAEGSSEQAEAEPLDERRLLLRAATARAGPVELVVVDAPAQTAHRLSGTASATADGLVVEVAGATVAAEWPPELYEALYLASEDPRAQSGFRGDEARWEGARRPIVEAIHRDGTLLDVGCANGLLMESLVRWSPHRLEPYGLDHAPALVELARARLPRWADRIFAGDVMEWEPPRRFDFVRTELYVPDRRRELVERLLGWLEPGGRLIVCSYGSLRSKVVTERVGEILRDLDFEVGGELFREGPEGALIRLAWTGVPG